MSHAIRITLSGGRQSIHLLTTPQISIGSDPSADVCVDGEAGMLPYHALLAPRRDECWVSTAPGAPFWDRSGNAISGHFVPWGSRLTLGQCVFELLEKGPEKIATSPRNPRPRTADTAQESLEAKRGGVHPGFLMVLIATLAYAGVQWGSEPDRSANRGLAAAPELFSDTARTCVSANPGHRARRAEEQALAKSERAVFDLQDGVEAVELFAEAESCYRKSGQDDLAQEVSAHGAEFRHGIQEQYDLIRLRLSRDLAAGDLQGARRQVDDLRKLFRHQGDSEYSQTLRRLSIRLSREGKTL